ncbi:HEAT repeat domain-containing protein [Thalassoglobus sp. JC818]|uniref:HEAT repeat domain-containing protein n=1 Tax=Thalassoglobus sp. JC818 TaxID=3232136 RepID=UPI00345AF6C4
MKNLLLMCSVALLVSPFGSVNGGEGALAARETIQLTDAQEEQCLKILREAMASDEFWPAMHAAEALTLAGYGDEVREALEPKLPAETDDQKRCGLARELVRAGATEYTATMLEILDKEDTYGHTHAAESLFKVDAIGNGKGLKQVLRTTTDMKTKLMAAAALARSGDERAMKLLRRELKSDDEQTFRIAAWILARIGDQSDVRQMRRNVKRANDPLVKAYNEHALATLGDEAGMQALIDNLSDDDPAIRTYAATFAGDARATEAKELLLQLLEDDYLDARIRAAQTLLVLSQPKA